MALAPGIKLGPYEILSPLGAGGMGEVYRARDTRLNRDVAIKILGESLVRNPDGLQRFQQEAQATAALNHPNILVIFDIGDFQGSPFLVSELLEGETLRWLFRSGRLPLRKAIDYATQVARGLAAAHGRGIVHRDLKPENIFITKDGRAKILDFGLARLTHTEGTNSGNSETVAFATEPGMVLGTIGYMSPEQVRGQPADSRSDIFAFGVVLHEMLSGQHVFRKASSADTMAAILKDDPPSVGLTHPNSPALDRVTQHCLEKDPAHRFQSASDLVFDLESLSGSSPTASLVAAESHRNLKSIKWILFATLATVAALGIGFGIGHRNATAAMPVWQRLTYNKGSILSARFAPDRHTVVYSAAWNGKPAELFTTRPESPESRPLGVKHAELLAVSQKGEMAMITEIVPSGEAGEGYRGTLARLPLEGGSPREILSEIRDADWASDSTNLAVTREAAGTTVLEFPIGHPLYKSGGIIAKPRISPQGDAIAFFDLVLQELNSVMIVDLAGHSRVVSKGWTDLTGLAWSPDGKEIWFTGSRTNGSASLYGVTREGRERVVSHFPGELNLYDVSQDGRVLLGIQSWRSEILAQSQGDKLARDLSWFDFSVPDAVSTDGRTVLFHESGEAGGPNWAAYIRATDGSPPTRLGDGFCMAISPDGNWALCSPASGIGALTMVPTRTGTPRTLLDDHLQHFGAQWLPDGHRLLLVGNEVGQGSRAYLLDLNGGAPRPITPEGVYTAILSPDGSRVAALFVPDGLKIYPVAGGAPSDVPGWTAGDSFAIWGKSNNFIFISKRTEFPTPIFRLDLVTGKRELWKVLSPPDPSGIRVGQLAFISPDEKTAIYSVERRLTDLFVVQGLH